MLVQLYSDHDSHGDLMWHCSTTATVHSVYSICRHHKIRWLYVDSLGRHEFLSVGRRESASISEKISKFTRLVQPLNFRLFANVSAANEQSRNLIHINRMTLTQKTAMSWIQKDHVHECRQLIPHRNWVFGVVLYEKVNTDSIHNNIDGCSLFDHCAGRNATSWLSTCTDWWARTTSRPNVYGRAVGWWSSRNWAKTDQHSRHTHTHTHCSWLQLSIRPMKGSERC